MRLLIAAASGTAAAILILLAVLAIEAPRPRNGPPLAATGPPTVTSAPRATATAAPVAPATHSPRPSPSPTPALADGVPLLAYAPGAQGELLDDNGWPRGATGPLVVYRREIREQRPRIPDIPLGTGTDVHSEIVTYDLGRGSEVAAVRLDEEGLPQLRLVGTTLFVRTDNGLWTYRLDGSEGRELLALSPTRYLERFEVSPDGSLVAVNYFWRPGFDDNHLRVVEVESGAVVLDFPQQIADDAGFHGNVGPDAWSSDGSTISLVGYTYSESPGGLGLLTLDGSLEVLGRRTPGRIEPAFDERQVVEVSGAAFECALAGYAGATRITLLDSTTDRVVNVATADDPALHLAGWSPTAEEYAFTVHDLPPDVAASVAAAFAEGRCPNDMLAQLAWAAPRTWWVIPVDGSPALEIGTLEELHVRWYGDRAITFACGGEVRGGIADGGLSHPQFVDPLCQGPEVHKLRVGGAPVGEGIHIEVIGFVDPP